MEWVQPIGIVASTCTAISLLPQLIKLIKTKKAEHLSLGMLIVLLGGYILWITYGFMKEDWIIVISNMVSLVLNAFTVVLSLRYKKNK